MSGGQEGHADGQGRVYQASGDLHIQEHHHSEPAWSGPDSVRRPAGRPPVVLRDRTELVTRLRAALAPGNSRQVYVLHGLGGCGKTAVAHALFQYAEQECGRVGLWVNAADRASLRAGMLAVAADRGASEGELVAARGGLRAAADLVWSRLDESGQPWLLVLDNADDPEVLHDGGWLRDSPGGIVLVTSRQAAPHRWPGAQRLHLGVLPREDAAQVLCDLAPETGTVQDAAEIADRLGRLPLALTLAGSFLAQQVLDPWTMTEYGRNLDSAEGLGLIDQAAPYAENSRHLLDRTWQLSLDALTAQGVPEASTLLRLLACWSSDPLPLSLLAGKDISSGLPRSRVEPALRGLLDHSLTELSREGVRCLRTHGVVLDSVARGTPAELRERLLADSVGLLSAAMPEIPQRGPRDPLLQLIAPHIVTLLRHCTVRATAAAALGVAVRLATALHRTGEYLAAHEVAAEAAAVTEQVLGNEHPAILIAHTRAGRALSRLGRYEEAESLHRRVLALCERVLGPDHPDTLNSRYGLLLSLNYLGRMTESIGLLRHVIADRERILGPGHPLTLYARVDLLDFLSKADMPEDALLQLPQECVRYLGAAHPLTLTARHNRAAALYRIGHIDDADTEAQQVVAEYQSRYGSDYPVTFAALQLYAQTQAAVDNFDRAVELMAAVVEGRIRTLGPEHPFVGQGRELLSTYRQARIERGGAGAPG